MEAYGDPKGGNTGQLIHTVLFLVCHLWDGESSTPACSTVLCFILRNKPVPPGWWPAIAPFCLQQEGSHVTGRAPDQEGVTRAMLNHIFSLQNRRKNVSFALGTAEDLWRSLKELGGGWGWRGCVRDCKQTGSGGIAGAWQRTGRNGTGAPWSDVSRT